MWHASASAINEATAWALAERALDGVGEPALGEWRERGRRGVVHLRRRLSDAERAGAGDLGVRDVRGTAEEAARLDRLAREVPALRDYLRR